MTGIWWILNNVSSYVISSFEKPIVFIVGLQMIKFYEWNLFNRLASTLSATLPPELAGVIPILEKMQVQSILWLSLTVHFIQTYLALPFYALMLKNNSLDNFFYASQFERWSLCKIELFFPRFSYLLRDNINGSHGIKRHLIEAKRRHAMDSLFLLYN